MIRRSLGANVILYEVDIEAAVHLFSILNSNPRMKRSLDMHKGP